MLFGVTHALYFISILMKQPVGNIRCITALLSCAGIGFIGAWVVKAAHAQYRLPSPSSRRSNT